MLSLNLFAVHLANPESFTIDSWQGEDSGPNVNSAADVLKLYEQARSSFPNATVRAAGLDEVAESLLRPQVRSKLPVLTHEV